jgi:hypothetical protein
VKLSDKFISAVKIAAQAFVPLPLGPMLAQWISDLQSAPLNERLDRLEDPLAKYGPRAKDLARVLYRSIQIQEHPTTHLDITPELKRFVRELNHFEADGLVTGLHAINGDYKEGLRLTNSAFIVYLAVLNETEAKIVKISEIMDEATTPLSGVEIRKSIDLPLTVINAFFRKYEEMGQGVTSNEVGGSSYTPHSRQM